MWLIRRRLGCERERKVRVVAEIERKASFSNECTGEKKEVALMECRKRKSVFKGRNGQLLSIGRRTLRDRFLKKHCDACFDWKLGHVERVRSSHQGQGSAVYTEHSGRPRVQVWQMI